MGKELSNLQLAELILIDRVSRRRSNTSSLKWAGKPSLNTVRHVSDLIAQGYILEWIIDHPHYSWQIGVSLKGENAITTTTLPKVLLDLFDEAGYVTPIGSLVSVATQEELALLLTHSSDVVRQWARNRFEDLNYHTSLAR